jgi:phenylalanyl-tRNA synthetase beta chain
MHLSYRWLARHVDLEGVTAEKAVRELTLSTAEVEGLTRFAPVLADVVVGHVRTREQHPQADKLSVCTVDVGDAQELQIVCGASNVAAGQKVAVARVGTHLPGDIKLKKAKIRGVESQGMICSERELALGDEHAGIWVLPEEAEVGVPVDVAIGADDQVIEIDNKSVTHRPDLWGHRGFAAELAAIFRREMRPLAPVLPQPAGGAPYPVRIESPACPRYLALCIDGVTNGRSPDWLRLFLLAVGQRPIDLLVDVSNFVMLDLGQPNHLFDRARLAAQSEQRPIVVRAARPGERMQTLDDVDRALTPDDLLICAGDEPVALAGVMGGAGSKVFPETRELLLEVANFEAGGVRKSAARLGLRTDASARFEKSLDPNLVPLAAAHLFDLLRAIQPSARLAAPVTDAGKWRDPARTVRLRTERARTVLGAAIPDEEMADLLRRLHFGVKPAPGGLEIAIPSIRATRDVTGEHDLVEELGRLHRYGNIPERPLAGPLVPPPPDARRVLVRKLEDRLALSARYHQAPSYSFLPDELVTALGISAEPCVELENPVIEGWQRVRRSVAPSLISLLPLNLRQRTEVRLFEIGKGYRPRAKPGEPEEVHELALVLAAPPEGEGAWDTATIQRAKATVEDLLQHVRRPAAAFTGIAAEGFAPEPWMHPVRAVHVNVAVADGTRRVGTLAELDPAAARRLGIEAAVAVATLSLDALLEVPPAPSRYTPLARFPEVKVDVALALPEAVPASDAAAAIERAGKGLVSSLELFDLFAGASLGVGKKSLAWHVVLQSDARTLDESDGQKFLERLEREVAALGGELRRA